VTYAYTGRDQVSAITADNSPVVTYSYDLNGSRTSQALPNTTTTSYGYDDAHRLLSLSHQLSTLNLASFAYAYNAVSDRTSRTETSGTSAPVSDTYSYDAVDQVTGVTYGASGRTVAYNYDSTGNRTSVVDNGATTSYSANNLNQYTAVGSLPPLTYDPNGNLTSYTGWTYTYDARNRLTSVNGGPSAVTATFAYDARNRCVSVS
jgi:YD repeat-containing protein